MTWFVKTEREFTENQGKTMVKQKKEASRLPFFKRPANRYNWLINLLSVATDDSGCSIMLRCPA